MRIIKNNGDIIECTVEEYCQVYLTNQNNAEIVKEVKVVKDIQAKLDEIKIPELKTEFTPLKKVERPGIGSGHGYRASSCLPWTKKEDKIILNNDAREALKLLPNRTYSAIASRMKKFRNNVIRKPNIARADDYRRKMMKWVNDKAKELQASHPEITHNIALGMAMDIYKIEFKDNNKLIGGQ